MPRARIASETCLGRWPWVAVGIGTLVAAVLAVYWPAISAGFVFDDDALVVHNSSLESGDALHRIWCTSENYEYLPITYTSFLVERRLWGNSASGYHLVSLVLHAINALLVWQVLRQLRVPGAWLAALLFAVHPVAASSVAWISEQKNLWGLLFCLASLSCYLEFQAGGWRGWYALSLVAFLAALLGKTSIVLAPVVILLCTWWQTGRIRRKDWLLTAPFFLLSLALGLVTVWFQFQRGIGETAIPIADFFHRFTAAGHAIWFYLGKDLVPIHLSMIYPRWDYSQLTIWPSLAVLAMGAIFWRFRRSWGRTALFASGCYLAMLLPILGFLKMSFMRYALVADHFQYSALPVATAVLVAVGAWSCQRALTVRRRWLAAAVPGLVVVLLGMLTWQQAEVFRNDESLWTATLRQNPAASVAHANLAHALLERNDLDESLPHFAEAARLDPQNTTWRYDYGTALMEHGDEARAVVEFTEAIRIDPKNGPAHNNLAYLLTRQHQGAEAAKHARVAIEIAPDLAEAHFNLGNAYALQSMFPEATREYREAIRLKPDYPEARANLRVVTGRGSQ